MPQLQPGMARIRVKDLCLRTYIGINEDEILNKQDVLINLTILYAAQDAVRDNDIDHALNYRTITKAIIAHVEGNRFALLERLTQELLDLVIEQRVGAVCRSRSGQAPRAALCRIGFDYPGGQPLTPWICVSPMTDQQRLELEAAAFRRLVAHLDSRKDVQNIDLMNLAGFCRNCLSKWYKAEADERQIDAEPR